MLKDQNSGAKLHSLFSKTDKSGF